MQCHALQLYSGSVKLKPVTEFSFSACSQLKQTQLQYFDFLATCIDVLYYSLHCSVIAVNVFYE